MQALDIALDLDQKGILRQRETLPELVWLNEDARLFLLDIYLAGEAGLRASRVFKWKEQHDEMFLRMEMEGLISWETTAAGRPTAATLTWKGDVAIKLLLRAAATQSSAPARPIRE